MQEEKHLSVPYINPRLVTAAKIFSEAMSIFVLLMGSLILIGWKFNIQILTSISPYFVPMTPNGALGLVFLGSALWFLQEKRTKKWMRNLGQGFAVFTSLLGIITIAEYVFKTDRLIDDLLFHRVSVIGLVSDFPGRIAIGTAFIFIFLGAALLLLDVKTKRGYYPFQILAIFAGIISIAAIVGYVHNIEVFYRVWLGSNAMSLYSALIFFMCHFGILLARPERGITRVVFINTLAGKVARILLPSTFIGPLIISWLVEFGEHHNLYSLQFSLGLETNVDIIAFFLLSMAGVCVLAKLEEKKILAEKILLDNEKKYHTLVDSMNEGMGVQDKNGILTFLNKRACDALGYKLEELIGKPTTILFDKENQKILKENIAKRKKGSHDKYEMKWLRKDGTNIDTIISPTPFFDADGNYNGSMAIYTDITELKKVEKKLAVEEKKYHNLVDIMNEGVGVQDKNGILTFINKRACEVLGYKQEELLGRSVSLLLGKTDQTNFDKRMEERRKGNKQSYELNWTRKDGTLVNTIVAPSPFFDDNGEYAGSVAVITDITELKKSAEKLKESEENFRNIFNYSADGILLIDVGKKKFILGNSAICKQLGYSPEEIKNLGIEDIHPKKDLPYVLEQFNQVVRGETSLNTNIPVKRKNGTIFYVDISASPTVIDGRICILGIFRDITEHKNALALIKKEQLKSAALADDLDKFKLAVDGAAEHIIITNADGNIIYANKAVETITGFSPEEAMGAKAGKIWGGHMPKEFYEKMWHTIKDEKKTFAGEVTNYKKNGTPYVASLNIAPILDENGSVEFFVGIERDITKEKKVEEMKNDFISFVSHQLRTPLTVMRWNAEMLRNIDSGKLNRDQKRYLAEIDRGENRMALLINSLLNISRLESGRLKVDPKPTDLVSFIRKIVDEGEPYASAKNCSIIFKKPKNEFPSVKLDQALTREVIANLIGNATRYSKPGKCEMEVTLEQKDKYYQINVVDNGIGIPVDVQDKIFAKFFRADNAVKFETEGTGLGLYMTKLLVETSGGKIWFESAEGKGSAFHFTIPVGGMRVVKGEKTLT